MSDKSTAASLGVRDAWDFWLSQHDISVPQIIEKAVETSATNAIEAWLEEHREELMERIARAAVPAKEEGK